ncbi:N-6 DNA methylase [Neptunicella sp. SCSIO 80796]|uniref:N-6 DNA methylase n=1 Tax=Neptunicella plasticusilytica TaxID=3117012 RepID=UPI003A4DAE9E
MISETLVIEITKAFIEHRRGEFVKPGITERKPLLGLFSLLLAHKVDSSRFSFFEQEEWSSTLTSAAYLENFSDSSVAELVISELSKISEKGWMTVVNKVQTASQFLRLSSLSVIDALTLYERVLHRLQEKAPKSPLQGSFPYQYWGEGFESVLKVLVERNSVKSIYSPNAHRGELTSYTSALIPSSTVFSETDEQSSTYVYQKLLITGAEEAHVYENSSLDQDTDIAPNSMDLAVTACVASVQSPAPTTLHRNELKGFFDPNRIDLTSLGNNPSKEFALIQHMLWALKEDGSGIVFTGKGPLQREKEALVRKSLLMSGAIESVIKLGDNLLGGRSTSVYALLLCKRKAVNEPVFFLDASDMFETRSRYSYLSDVTLFHESIASKSNGVTVEPEKVIEGDAVLFPEFYLSKTTEVKMVDIDRLKLKLKEAQKTTDKCFALLKEMQS